MLLGGGLLRCASCGCGLSLDTTKAHGKTYPFYRLDGLRAELADAEEELRELVESEEPIPASVLAACGKVLQARVASAQEALEQAEAAREVPLTFPSSAEAWEALSVPEKPRIITALIGRVVVRRGRGLHIADRIKPPDAPRR